MKHKSARRDNERNASTMHHARKSGYSNQSQKSKSSSTVWRKFFLRIACAFCIAMVFVVTIGALISEIINFGRWTTYICYFAPFAIMADTIEEVKIESNRRVRLLYGCTAIVCGILVVVAVLELRSALLFHNIACAAISSIVAAVFLIQTGYSIYALVKLRKLISCVGDEAYVQFSQCNQYVAALCNLIASIPELLNNVILSGSIEPLLAQARTALKLMKQVVIDQLEDIYTIPTDPRIHRDHKR